MIPEGTAKHFVSQFSMGQLDFERYNSMLAAADRCGIEVWYGKTEYVKRYYSILKQFYKNIRWIIIDRGKIDDLARNVERLIKQMEDLKKQGKDCSYMLPTLYKYLEAFVDIIYEFKQKVGLGIEVRKQMSDREKWNRAARLGI